MGVLCACSDKKTPPPLESHEAFGAIDIAVGKEVRSFELGAADCELVDAGDRTVLQIVAPAATTRTIDGKPTRPNLLTARLPAGLDVETVTFGPDQSTYSAIASVVDTTYEDEPYRLLQVLAHSAEGGPAHYTCSASRKAETLEGDDTITLVCNDARVFPWFTNGPVPVGSFRAKIGCRPS